MNSEKKSKMLILIAFVLVLSLGANIYFLLRKPVATSKKINININTDQKIKDIETYLDSISPSYIADEKALAVDANLPSWGCGPSSYALAKIINKRFFNNELVIDASYNNIDPYEIIERFGLAVDNGKLVDHAWLEIFFENKFLFIDPTIGQFGKINKIAYQVFDAGDPTIKDILNRDYNIEDIRLSVLVPKLIDRIPVDQSPYPGITINQSSVDYFLKVLEVRNSINDGIEPNEWKDWVTTLMNKYVGAST